MANCVLTYCCILHRELLWRFPDSSWFRNLRKGFLIQDHLYRFPDSETFVNVSRFRIRDVYGSYRTTVAVPSSQYLITSVRMGSKIGTHQTKWPWYNASSQTDADLTRMGCVSWWRWVLGLRVRDTYARANPLRQSGSRQDYIYWRVPPVNPPSPASRRQRQDGRCLLSVVFTITSDHSVVWYLIFYTYTCRPLGYERVYLPLCKVADTFRIHSARRWSMSLLISAFFKWEANWSQDHDQCAVCRSCMVCFRRNC